MHLEYLIPALVLGLGGSLHCIGMCGPLMYSSILCKREGTSPYLSWILYQSGRIMVYGLWGGVLGLLGTSAKWFGLQQNMSLTMGVFILVVLILIKVFPGMEQQLGQNLLFNIIRQRFIPFIHSKIPAAAFMGGMLNGMLPCGLVYVALAGATAVQDPLHGAVFMMIFGTGTLPMMLLALVMGKTLKGNIRFRLATWYPVLIGCMGLMLIIRGMNLGNLLSPALQPNGSAALHCAPR